MSECNDTCKYYKNCWSRGESLKEDGEECAIYEPDRPHGEWISFDDKRDRCSVCDIKIGKYVGVFYKFCPNCGADMRKHGEAE